MGIRIKPKRFDNDGIAPLIAGLLVLAVVGAITIAGIAVYQLTVKPDIIYNISDTGFSLAGLDIDSLWLIVGIGIAILFLFVMFRKK